METHYPETHCPETHCPETLNLGILAHVDAGKTSLTERLLFAAGVIDEIGRVDDGSTQTDTLALERQRGITIKSAVVSFGVGDRTVNLIDTPGHPDFIAEVDRALSVLDGAVLVLSAVEGVQTQTRVLMRALRRQRIPTLIFVNKIDRGGARDQSLLRDISAALTPHIVAMGAVSGLGTRGAAVTPYDDGDEAFTVGLTDLLTSRDDDFLAVCVAAGTAIPAARLRAELAAQAGRGLVVPVFLGSAVTGAGIAELVTGIKDLLPAASGDRNGPVAGTIFKVERGPGGERIGYVRMYSGTIRARDRLRLRGDSAAKVTAIGVYDRGPATQRASIAAGQIGKLWGLGDIRTGDRLGAPSSPATTPHFPPPTLETVVVPTAAGDKGALYAALNQLAEQDPLINVRQDDVRQELIVSLYGEVQKEVIQATLASDFGIAAGFRETSTICREYLAGSGAAVEVIKVADNPFLATVGLRIEPGPPDSGVCFALAVEPGSLPLAFFTAVQDAVRETLRQGLSGWEVTDCVVTMTHSGYWARQSHAHGTFDASMSSTAGDFRNLTPLVLMSALVQAGTVVQEPIHHFRLEVPVQAAATILPVLARLRGVPRSTLTQDASCLLEGDIPAARVHDLQQLLPGLAGGAGLLDCGFDRYQPVRGTVPIRPRSGSNPLSRSEYLVQVAHRMAGH